MEKVFRNILVPVDGSLQSKTAQNMAILFSQTFKSQVIIMHVISNELTLGGQTYIPRENYMPISTATGQFPRALSLPKTGDSVFPDEVVKEVTEGFREEGQSILDESAALFSKKGVVVEAKLVERNDTAEAIVSEADSGRFDLVIIGNSGGEENELDLHLGSVANKVALAAKISVLVVRKKRDVKKILVPVDGSAKEEKVLQKVGVIAKATGSEVVLLHVQEKSLLRIRPEIREVGLQVLKNASTSIDGITSEQKLLSGDPANAIVKTASQNNVDLIIMSSGGKSYIRGFFLGSVSDHVLHHATVPVLLLK